MEVAAIIVAAGSGERLGADRPKALVELAGRPMLDWTVETFRDHPRVDSVLVIAPAEAVVELGARLRGRASVVAGGSSRQRSVELGLAALADSVDTVLVHDAARPLVTATVISAVLDGLAGGARAVIPVLPMTDTVKRVDARGVVRCTVERAELRLVQTPQGFARELLVAAHAASRQGGQQPVTDDAGLVEALGVDVHTVPGEEAAFKITTPHDLELARRLVSR